MTPAGIAYVALSLMFLVTLLAAYFATCAWLHLVRRNAEVLNPTYRHRHSVGWVWASWLVPVVSLWFPYQLVADVRGATSPQGRSGVALLQRWWAAWLLLLITSNTTSTVLPLAGASDETWATWDAPLQALAALFGVAALAAWLRIIRDISNTQARSAVAQGWSPALAWGGPTTPSAPAAAGPPQPEDVWPETVAPLLPAEAQPTGTPVWAPAVPGAPPPSRPGAYPGPPAPYPETTLPPWQSRAGAPGIQGAWWGRPPSSAMGVWAFVLALLPLCVTWLVAIGLAIAVLLRPDDGYRRGRGLAIAALAISSMWILLCAGLIITAATLPAP